MMVGENFLMMKPEGIIVEGRKQVKGEDLGNRERVREWEK